MTAQDQRHSTSREEKNQNNQNNSMWRDSSTLDSLLSVRNILVRSYLFLANNGPLCLRVMYTTLINTNLSKSRLAIQRTKRRITLYTLWVMEEEHKDKESKGKLRWGRPGDAYLISNFFFVPLFAILVKLPLLLISGCWVPEYNQREYRKMLEAKRKKEE